MASIVKRKKKYSVVYTYTDENGNKRQKWETFETNRCSCPLPSSNSSVMPMPTAPVGGFLCRSMCWARS